MNPVNVLILGSGAREHALAWKLKQSPLLGSLYVTPGNGGTVSIARNLRFAPTDVAGILAACQQLDIHLVVAGMEAAVAAGVTDACLEAGVAVFGPSRAAGRLESSKAFAKEVMAAAGVPTAQARLFNDPDEATRYVEEANRPLVIKADGLAAGKGVVVAMDTETALDAINATMRDRIFGDAGDQVLIEEFLDGTEVSYHVIVDGESFLPMVPASDFKRAFDNDQGPNTGGMGCISPPSVFTADIQREVDERIVRPVLAEMVARGTPYRGVLYVGLMIVDSQPYVLEFNARFGDPETQVMLPRLKSDLLDLMLAATQDRLSTVQAEWDTDATVAVVIASGGYPGEIGVGYPIGGLDRLHDVLAFHAGTRQRQSLSYPPTLETSGGRVLTLVGRGANIAEARDAVYRELPKVYFVARHYRTDIGLAEVKRLGLTTHVVVVPPPPRRSANAEAYEAGDNPGPAGGLEGQVPTGKRKRRRRKRNRGGSNNEPAGAAQGDA